MKHLLFTLLLLTACSLFALEVDWSKAKPVQTGALLLKFELSEPRLEKINLMRIDLRTPGLTFTGTARDPDWGKPMPDYPKGIIRTKRIRTRDFMLNCRKQGLNMIVAANSAPWSPWQKPFTHKYANPAGLGILDGEVICDRRPHRAVFRVDRDGRVDIVESVPEQEYSKIRVAASGFAIILRNGEILAGRNYEKDPMPRIAYGLSKDRHYFYILTVDGRQKGWSLVATGRELATMLRDAGAADAINMDGGGSPSATGTRRNRLRSPSTATPKAGTSARSARTSESILSRGNPGIIFHCNHGGALFLQRFQLCAKPGHRPMGRCPSQYWNLPSCRGVSCLETCGEVNADCRNEIPSRQQYNQVRHCGADWTK